MVTVAPVQEREEEEKSQAREQMEIEFSQELPVVDHIPALHRRVIGVGLLDFLLFFLFGHGWRERSKQGGDKGLYRPGGGWHRRGNVHAQQELYTRAKAESGQEQ